MSRARGLTILETVAAAALLALLGATGASLLIDARQRLERPEGMITTHDLARLADLLVEQPEEAGFAGTIEEMNGATLTWPDDFELPEAPPVALRFVETSGFTAVQAEDNASEKPRRAWVALECDGLAVARWIVLPQEEEEATAP